MRSVVKIKSYRNGKIILPFTGIGKSCHSHDLYMYVANMSFNVICESKILAKISEFTVYTKKKV